MALKGRLDYKYPSCSRTYSTLCIYHDTADPQKVTDILQMAPDRTRKVGELIREGVTAPVSGWFFSTKNKKQVSRSKDMRAHVEWLLDRLNTKKNELRKLAKSGYILKISCFWVSASGNGGPALDHEFTKKLAQFPLDLEFDIWFDVENWMKKGKKEI